MRKGDYGLRITDYEVPAVPCVLKLLNPCSTGGTRARQTRDSGSACAINAGCHSSPVDWGSRDVSVGSKPQMTSRAPQGQTRGDGESLPYPGMSANVQARVFIHSRKPRAQRSRFSSEPPPRR